MQFPHGSGVPQDLAALGGSVVFNGFDEVHAQEPWISDGTPQGTRMLKDIQPSGSNYSFSKGYFRFGNAVYFSATTDAEGAELWKTNGTSEGTVFVEDLWQGFGNSDPRSFVEMNGVMYFLATQPDLITQPNGSYRPPHLWRSDGTAEGTFALKAIPNATRVVASGSTLFVGGSSTLWKSDGTEAGTVPVRSFGQIVYSLTPYRGGVAFQVAENGRNWEPWFSDGTPQGTVMLGDLDPRSEGSAPLDTGPMPVSLSDRVLFVGTTGTGPTAGRTLQITDGTAAGTTRLSNAYGIRGLTKVGDGALFFSAAFQELVELWRTDGTEQGTARVSDMMFDLGQTVALGNTLFFGARGYNPNLTGGAPGLYRSDGTAAGTVLLKAFGFNNSPPANITPVGDEVYFTTGYSGGWAFDLWKTDGTEAGTVLVKQFTGGTLAYTPVGLADLNGKLVFRTYRGSGGAADLYVSDGTPEGTVSPGLFGYNPAQHDVSTVVVNGVAYFAASPFATPGDVELWKTDGTVPGTVRVKDVWPGTTASNPRSLAAYDGRLYFSAADPVAGFEMWSTDGTEGGTARVTDLRPGNSGSAPRFLGEVAGRLYFTANDGTRGTELWSTDGTAAGTAIVHDVYPAAGPGGVLSWPRSPVALSNPTAGDRVIFWADDLVHGMEPWSAPRPGAPTNDFIVGRHLFYNNSRWDGRTEGASRSDDGAIAPDKQPLFPGGVAGFENVSGYSRGLNGVMIDVYTRLPGSSDVVMSFRVGTGAPNSPWLPAPTPLAISRRNDGLPKDIDRFTVIWPDHSIRNKWLRVTIEAMSEGVVAGRDEFYFGHLAAETGDPVPAGSGFRVTTADFVRTRAATSARPAGPANRFDHNRDGFVNVLDLNVVRGNFFAALPPPTQSAAAAPGPFARGNETTRYRPGVWDGLGGFE
jgi:ELWxxDGT repeat protein